MTGNRHVSWAPVALLLIAVTWVSPSNATMETSIWSVSIDNRPAPPPAERPPFSRGARRDPSMLVFQIPGIVGGYVGFLLILAVALLIFGRRLRRDAQSSRSSLSMEMVKPLRRALDPSPVSPSDSAAGWWKRMNQQQKGDPSIINADSPSQPSIGSFDDKVVDKDKAQRQDEMERIYAVVMSDDNKTPSPKTVRERDFELPSVRSPTHMRDPSSSSRSFSQRQPPQIRGNLHRTQSDDLYTRQNLDLASPVQSMYPSPAPPSPYYIAGASSLRANSRPVVSPPPQNLPSVPRNAAVKSHSRQNSSGSTRSRSGRTNIRTLQISAPMPVPANSSSVDQANNVENRTPLSPHYIPSNPPRPPLPPVAPRSRSRTPIEDHEEDQDDSLDDIPPYYSEIRSAGHQRDDDDDDDIVHAYGGEDIAGPRPPPLEAPHRSVPDLTPYAKGLPHTPTANLAPRQQSHTTPLPSNSPNNNLPFRTYQPQLPPPTSTSPANTKPYQAISPGPIKTTFLSPRRDRFMPGGMNPIGPNGVPTSAALLSAGLATPYSPYMPFSPITPVTPHLTSRRERRARQRDERRTVPTQEHRVQDEQEMWGDGWS